MGKDGHGFIGVLVKRWTATAKIIVVHRRQVVVHQAEAVNQFNLPILLTCLKLQRFTKSLMISLMIKFMFPMP